jgi:hypothetical protein
MSGRRGRCAGSARRSGRPSPGSTAWRSGLPGSGSARCACWPGCRARSPCPECGLCRSSVAQLLPGHPPVLLAALRNSHKTIKSRDSGAQQDIIGSRPAAAATQTTGDSKTPAVAHAADELDGSQGHRDDHCEVRRATPQPTPPAVLRAQGLALRSVGRGHQAFGQPVGGGHRAFGQPVAGQLVGGGHRAFG